MQQYTPALIVAIPIILGLIDVALYFFGGNEATISAVMLQARSRSPLVALSTSYTFAVLLTHLFLPTFTLHSPPAEEVLGRMFVALSPTMYALCIIGLGPNTANAAHTAALQAGGQIFMALYMLAAIIVGGAVGYFVLPQHLPPGVTA